MKSLNIVTSKKMVISKIDTKIKNRKIVHFKEF